MIPSPKNPKSPKTLALLLLAVLPVSGAQAAQTATVSGTPPLYAGPGTTFDPTGTTLPAGALVTLERCSTDLASGNASAGLIQPAPGAGDWCLVRGAGWVDAGALVNVSGDPTELFTGSDWLDPLTDAAPAWDDPTDPDQ
jgi:hypothetical protein